MTLSELLSENAGYVTDRWEQYVAVYEREVGALKQAGKPIRLLEVGVQNGGSLALWERYLPEGSQIVGIDIDQNCSALEFSESIEVIIVDSGDVGALSAAVSGREFDVIIDDGSHRQSDVLSALDVLFPKLSAGGLYFIEDLHCAYWPSHEGGFRVEVSAIERLKSYVDALNSDYFSGDPNLSIEATELDRLKELNGVLARISFFDSMAVLEKYPSEKDRPFRRIISGGKMQVTEPAPLAEAIANNRSGFLFSDSALKTMEPAVLLIMEARLADYSSRVVALTGESARLAQELEGLRMSFAEAKGVWQAECQQLVSANAEASEKVGALLTELEAVKADCEGARRDFRNASAALSRMQEAVLRKSGSIFWRLRSVGMTPVKILGEYSREKS